VRDVFAAVGWSETAAMLDRGTVRVGLALAFLWGSVWLNVRGVEGVQRVLVPLMFLMFGLGGIVIVAGFAHDHADFAAALAAREGAAVPVADAEFGWGRLLAASAILFSSFIGFDSIAQAGGEAKDPGRSLPLAIGIAVGTVGLFVLLFTAAVDHAVPGSVLAERASSQDLTAPGLLGYLLEPRWTVLILAGAAIALVNDLPAMLLAVSRLMFAWAEDDVVPRGVAAVHPRWHTPHVALALSGAMATAAILGSHLAGDFFLGVDILVTSMLVNFGLMCATVLALPRHNPHLAARTTWFGGRALQVALASAGVILLCLFLVVHVWKDLTSDVGAWYFHSTPLWLGVMGVATAIYLREIGSLRRSGVDIDTVFRELPPE
jgi:amino acid transporter